MTEVAVLQLADDGLVVLDDPVDLPAVLDLLIVGGGPTGTAAAFRAKELGVSALVIEYDDLMKRIRDYAKDKLILPHFGGGGEQRFPAGGESVAELCFGPIDKDDMCARWKAQYRKYSIPAQIGVELTGLERRDDGVWLAGCWNHRLAQEQQIAARHVAFGLGRGVPRRFDIPGNSDGIGYRLGDAADHCGRPSLVIGGGTSAAEAVIAISNAKRQSDDPTPVYWSYRGERMPRVSKALGEEFFAAFVGNGNIRYLPGSEPAAIVTASDREEYLSLRIDRKLLADRPNESSYLEFRKESCIACIGEDIPEALLRSCGVFMATGGKKRRKRMVVNRLLESEQPNLYLIGDILSQAYLEAETFAENPEDLREVKHRGNVKSALRDGVLVAQVVRQRLDGKEEIDVAVAEVAVAEVEDEEGTGESRPVSVVLPPSTVESSGPPAASAEDSRAETESDARLVHRVAGGVSGDEYPLRLQGVTTIGRRDCDICFGEDTVLSERHASIMHGAEGYVLYDDASETGVYLCLHETRFSEVADGDLLRCGRQFLRFSLQEERSVVHFDAQGKEIGRYAVTERTLVLGRQSPEGSLDENDRTLSRRHVAILLRDGRVLVKDLKSANGTLLKATRPTVLEDGDSVRIGQQILTLSLDSEPAVSVPEPASLKAESREAVAERPRTAVEAAPAGGAEAGEAGRSGGSGERSVNFTNRDTVVEVGAGVTLCEAAEKHGVSITAECHSGICGSDPIRIVAGAENLSPISDGEAETLEDICDLEPGKCRLACMVKISGPVEVEILDP